jgi:hypothetical protein
MAPTLSHPATQSGASASWNAIRPARATHPEPWRYLALISDMGGESSRGMGGTIDGSTSPPTYAPTGPWGYCG